MLLSLCNEVLRERTFAEQCRMAAALGYGGLEIAPFTLCDDPSTLREEQAHEWRHVAADHGLAVTGLHWLLIAPEGLSITTDDAHVRRRTVDLLLRLVDVCAAMGGTVLVHGSPRQRLLAQATSPEAARANARECLRHAAERAAAAGLTYCLEPLSDDQTDYVNTIAEAVAEIETVGSQGLATMIDTSSASLAEKEDIADLVRRWWPGGHMAHVQVNDRNRRAPGQGDDRFAAFFAALREVDYQGPVAVEPFVYEPDGPTTAAFAAGYLRGLLETAS
ncbi:MAG: sugar phosphate isomerase/epimerase [Geminicoccaceae bacterium]|nr:sugar phosphate isomerase/epimerase [Geminicoccaceae bacterium]